MNSYIKYAPNVFLAKCPDRHEKGETIQVETKYGKENDCIVFNLIVEKDGYFYYSIVRADGFNTQEWAKKRAERLQNFAQKADEKSDELWKKSSEGKEFLSLGEPIKIGHHSEKRHRALIERNAKRMDNSIAESKKAEEYASRAEYWEEKAKTINLSMPESLEFYENMLELAEKKHADLLSGKTEKRHDYSLSYAKKHVNLLKKQLETAKKLWA